jgi:hypothetical protein
MTVGFASAAVALSAAATLSTATPISKQPIDAGHLFDQASVTTFSSKPAYRIVSLVRDSVKAVCRNFSRLWPDDVIANARGISSLLSAHPPFLGQPSQQLAQGAFLDPGGGRSVSDCHFLLSLPEKTGPSA